MPHQQHHNTRKTKRGNKIKPMPRPKSDFVKKERISVEAIRALYIQAQQFFRTFPTLTDAQLREYFFREWPKRRSFPQLYKALTSRGTDGKAYGDILRVHSTVTDLQTNDYSPAREEQIVSDMYKQVKSKKIGRPK
jgi:hypothetical protein